MVAALRHAEYRWLVVEHSLEIYGGIIAALFAALGIWLGLRPTRRVDANGGKPGTTAATVAPRQTLRALTATASAYLRWVYATRTGNAGARRGGPEQQGDRRARVRQRKHGQDPSQPGV